MPKLEAKPGIYPDIPFIDYYNLKADNASLLKVVANSTLAKAKASLEIPFESSPAKEKGSALHCMMLESALFEEQFVRGLVGDDGKKLPRRSAAQKAEWAAFELKHERKTVIPADDWDDLFIWRERLLADPDAKELFDNAIAKELTIVWEDSETGRLCKARIDMLSEYRGTPVIVDLKKVREGKADPRRDTWGKECAKYGYDIQHPFYLDGLNTLAPADRSFLFLCVEEGRPYPVVIHELDQASEDSGRNMYRKAQRRWAKAIEDDHFPSYGGGIHVARVPDWRLDMEEK